MLAHAHTHSSTNLLGKFDPHQYTIKTDKILWSTLNAHPPTHVHAHTHMHACLHARHARTHTYSTTNLLGLLDELQPLTASRPWGLAHHQGFHVDVNGLGQGVGAFDATLTQRHLWLGLRHAGWAFFICIAAAWAMTLRLWLGCLRRWVKVRYWEQEDILLTVADVRHASCFLFHPIKVLSRILCAFRAWRCLA